MPSPLRNRGFRALMAYRLCSILSYQMVAVTVGCVTLGVVGVTSWRAPKLRRLDLRELQ